MRSLINRLKGHLLDVTLILTKDLVNCIHVIIAISHPVDVTYVGTSLVSLPRRILCLITMPDTNSHILMDGSSRI